MTDSDVDDDISQAIVPLSPLDDFTAQVTLKSVTDADTSPIQTTEEEIQEVVQPFAKKVELLDSQCSSAPPVHRMDIGISKKEPEELQEAVLKWVLSKQTIGSSLDLLQAE